MGAHLHSAWHGGQPTTKGTPTPGHGEGAWGSCRDSLRTTPYARAGRRAVGEAVGPRGGRLSLAQQVVGGYPSSSPLNREGRVPTGLGVQNRERPFALSALSVFPSFLITPSPPPPLSLPSCLHAKSLQLCPTPCDPMDHSLPGSSVHGILQSRILEWVAISSRGP